MDPKIALILVQDGLLNGAIYALLGLALVMVFAVTRVIFIPQGEFVAYGALTLAFLVSGKTPGTIYLLLILGVLTFLIDLPGVIYARAWRRLIRTAVWTLLLPVVLYLLASVVVGKTTPFWIEVLYTFAVVVPMGPMVYRLAFQPAAEASVLVLLILAMAVHIALMGLGLAFFGAEGWHTPPFVQGQVHIGPTTWPAQTLMVLGTCGALIIVLWLFFGRTLYGRALRATAINRRGARLMGISTNLSGSLTFTVAAAIGVLSGMLVAPVTPIYYDTGFVIGLKGFVAAIFGGMLAYPAAVMGALFIGLVEAFSSFWASPYKDIIVFSLMIPVLLWLSLHAKHVGDEE